MRLNHLDHPASVVIPLRVGDPTTEGYLQNPSNVSLPHFKIQLINYFTELLCALRRRRELRASHSIHKQYLSENRLHLLLRPLAGKERHNVRHTHHMRWRSSLLAE